MSVREALPAALYLPQEEPQEEDDGVLLLLHVCEVPLRTAQLHRPARLGHPRTSLLPASFTEFHHIPVKGPELAAFSL